MCCTNKNSLTVFSTILLMLWYCTNFLKCLPIVYFSELSFGWLLSVSTNYIYTHTHTTIMAVWILCGTTRVSQYQKKLSPTHTYCGHQLSLICFIHLMWSMFLRSFSAICPSFIWSTSWPVTIYFILHTFLHPVISQHMPVPLHPVLL